MPELQLYHYKARIYSPYIGRFFQTDPVGFKDDVNLYSYVGNDPMNSNDPTGKFLNFVAKFAVDVSLTVAIQVATGEPVDLGAALVDAAVGSLNPAKTIQKVAKLGKALTKAKGKAKTANTSKSPKSGSCCFVAGTLVLTEQGYKNIEDVQLGEKLWAKDIDTGEQAWKPVTKIFVEPDRGIYEIKLLGEDGFEQTIEATDDHPFYVVDHGWKTTIELASGDRIETDGKDSMAVVSVVDEKREDLTYNFTVADFHTYYVTERRVLVHNCGEKGDVAKSARTPVGRKGQHLDGFDTKKPTNAPGKVGDRDFSGHSFDRMQSQGIPPAAVENAIKNGNSITGKVKGTTAHHDKVNNMTVITDTASGRVVTVDRGIIKQ